MFAETHNFVGLAAHVTGHVDVDALSTAFDALLAAHPVLGAHLECDADGRHEIATDDLEHPGMEVVELDRPEDEAPPIHLDQSESLVQFRTIIRDGETEPILYVHHSLADGHHQFRLIEELFAGYTDLVSTGTMRAVAEQPAPDPLETVLAVRGIRKQQRSGLERFMPAMFAYDLPPSRRAATGTHTDTPLCVPMAWCRLSETETSAMIDFCRAHKLSLNAVLSAAVLLAEHEIRGTPAIPIPYIYPVDLRYVLSPPVSASGCTNPVGVATYLAEIGPHTSVVDLARDIADTFKADLAEGVIQQSLLHFSPQYVGNPPGLPDVVMLTDNGLVPPMRTPPGLELTASHAELYFAVDSGIDLYSTKVFAGRLMVEYHSHGPDPEKSVAAIHARLRDVTERTGAW